MHFVFRSSVIKIYFMSISVGGISVFAPILYSKYHLRTRSVFLDRSCRRLVEVGLVDCPVALFSGSFTHPLLLPLGLFSCGQRIRFQPPFPMQ